MVRGAFLSNRLQLQSVVSMTIGNHFHMAKKKKRVSWSAEDVRALKSMAKKKTTAPKIAKALKRTEGATRQKAFSLGLSLDSRA
jgi:hypothetical protein